MGGIRITDLRKRYGSVEAVRGLSLEVREGETFGLLGPNGAGKTTTLSMLSTLFPPSHGDAQIFGKSLTGDVSAVRRVVGLAPQEISLYPDLSGAENLEFFGRLHGVRGQRLHDRSRELLELVGLFGRKDDRVRTYSGGMQRRLNLACSLVHEPRLLLLDEPTAGVDAQSRDNLFGAIRRIAEEGTTVLYTTHYMEEAERLCDRIAIMDEGEVKAMGSLAELLEIVGMGDVVEIKGVAAEIWAERFEAIPEVIHVEAAPSVTRLFVKNTPRALAAVGAMLATENQDGHHLEVYPVNLERVFMHLTGKALRD